MSVHDSDNLPSNLSDNEHFQTVVDRVVSRRGFLKMGAGASAAAFLAGAASSAVAGGPPLHALDRMPERVAQKFSRRKVKMGFDAVPANSGDAVVVPTGYRAEVIAAWGAALFANSPAWKDDGTNTGADQGRQVGDNHDGMHFFPLHGNSSKEGLLVVNHEYTNYEYLFGAEYMSTWTADKVLKAQNAHGISVLHVRQHKGLWDIVMNSKYNRRLTGNSPMELTGPAAGDDLLKTTADRSGRRVLGTLNNCGNGYTFWGTYLTCEENFNGYFGTTAGVDARDAHMRRYGLSARSSGYRWEEFDDRFDYVKEPNESNRFGWIVEIDPFDPNSTPKKRTALGRFKHENCAMTLSEDNRVVVYSGDDQANDYIYKFVSDGKFHPGNPRKNRDLLDSGKLYVARFNDGGQSGDFMGVGEWILLDKAENPILAASSAFASQAEVLIKARLAADLVGATKMDRPEWITVHPESGEVYCTLTNNSGRAVTDTNDANPRAANSFGQIVRWREAAGDAAAIRFEWDLFVIVGNPVAFPDRSDLRSGSGNITVDNTFNSPDGLAFDEDGRLWIQSDGNFSSAGVYQGQGNNQMLCADPESREIRRFLVGPAGCEITGITWTPDQRTMFICVQHPGEVGNHPNRPTSPVGVPMDAFLAANPTAFTEWPKSQWSDVVGGGRPRSAVVVITKEDGGVIGS
ncbi:MAG: PhoX family phosphatase [Gammaproteobacteria bacterium]|jgi:secreted PhoX family phosphatase|nr:PhoX family phosphatase [Gammaproteobacteria bacterium]